MNKKRRQNHHLIGAVDDIGDGGGSAIAVSTKRYIEMDTSELGAKYPIELNAWEARQLARALLKAADKI